MSSKYNGMELKTNNTKKSEKLTNMWKLNNSLLNNQQVKKTSYKKLEATLR